jgi:hypothetical protein
MLEGKLRPSGESSSIPDAPKCRRGKISGRVEDCTYPNPKMRRGLRGLTVEMEEHTIRGGHFKTKPEPKPNPNRPNCQSIRVFGFGSYMCYISGYGFGS